MTLASYLWMLAWLIATWSAIRSHRRVMRLLHENMLLCEQIDMMGKVGVALVEKMGGLICDKCDLPVTVDQNPMIARQNGRVFFVHAMCAPPTAEQ